jgi:N-acyl-D-amino-acid deacylase
MLDLVLKNGTIIDGTGAPGRRADVGLRGDRIAAVGPVTEAAAEVLDVSGRVVAPGFIDMHSHTDFFLLVDPNAESKVTQGVTTEVCGNCGSSPGPWLHPVAREQARKNLQRYGLEPDWTTLGEFMDVLDRHPLGLNFVTLVGHGNLRASAMGYDNRPPTAAELDRMCGLLEDELAAGACGYSSGLIYPPGCYSDSEELVALGKVLARLGAFYATHMRNESHAVVEAVDEALRVGREGGCGVQISHHKACGKSNWGRVEVTLANIDRARAEGVDVHMDQYPYIATSTGLGTVLPRWAHEGGAERALTRLRDPDTRARILEEVSEAGRTGYYADSGGWKQLLIAGVRTDENRWAEGLDLEQVGERLGCGPEEAALRLLDEEDLAVHIVHFSMCEEDVERVMIHPLTMIGSDGSARSTSGILGQGKPHPRAFGTFPRVLSYYVRERRLLPLETAIHKMTGLPAARLGLPDRGVLRAGAYADLVVFAPDRVRDVATFTEPQNTPAGIDYVWVNGTLAAQGGKVTRRHNGKVLRRK